MAGIDNRKDILLLLLYMPGEKGEIAEPISGRTRLMKLLFLLQRDKGIDKALNIKNYYQYEAYDYGPFSKDVFEDLQFLRNVGLIETNSEDKRSVIEEWEDYLLTLESALESEGDDFEPTYLEESFTLTNKGIEFVEERLLPNLDEEIKGRINSVKEIEGALSLTSLLRYVYNKYPDSAEKSKLSHLY